jgi:hypothetical protein
MASSPETTRIVCWFSAGAASAVATKLLLAERRNAEVAIVRVIVPEEDPDNDRFAADCAAWFGQPIREIRSTEWASCEELWEARRYMSGPNGAICTGQMKKVPRYAFEAEWHPDQHVFGFTAEEGHRIENLRPEVPGILAPLHAAGLGKEDCYAIVQRAGLLLPLRYRQGFPNANCRGCVKAQSPRYWNLERQVNPDVFARRAAQSRRLGVRLVKLTSGTRERIFLDDLDPQDMTGDLGPSADCGILCAIAESRIKEVA